MKKLLLPAAMCAFLAPALTACQEPETTTVRPTSSALTCAEAIDRLRAPAAAGFAAARGEHDLQAARLVNALATANGAERDQAVGRLELLYELRADELAPEQRDFTLDLYRSYPGAASICAPALALPAPPVAFDAELRRCHRLGQPHVSPAAAEPVADACAELAAATAALPAQVATSYRPLVAQASAGVMARALAEPIFGDSHPGARTAAIGSVADLQTRLQRIDRWYKNLRRFVYPNGADLEPLWAQTSQVVAGLWEALRLPDYAALDASQDPTPDAVKLLDQHSFELERTVLTALFTKASDNRLPLAGAPVLYFLGDALTPLQNRTRSFSGFHDLSCLYLGCEAVPTSDGSAPRRPITALSARWRVLAALYKREALGTALDSATKLALGDWADTFKKIYENHDLIDAAVLDVLQEPSTADAPTLALGDAMAASSGGRDYARLITESAQKWKNYTDSGLFDNRGARLVPVGLSQAKAGDVENELGLRATALRNAVDDYNRHYGDFLHDLLDQITRSGGAKSLEARAVLKLAEFIDLEKRITGHRLRDEAQKEEHGKYGKKFQEMIDAAVIDGDDAAQVDTDVVTVAAGDAHWADGKSVVASAVRRAGTEEPYTFAARAGEMINITVTGQYSPTCSLTSHPRKAPTADKLERSVPIEATGALTGPQGFYLSKNGNSYEAKEHTTATTKETYSADSDTQKVCAGAEVSAQADLGVVKAEAFVRVEACTNFEEGNRDSSSDSNSHNKGNESRVSSALQAGLRVDNTPFPDMPAGALLLVMVGDDGAGGRVVRNAQVVMPQSTFVVSSDVDVYLVVNDEGGCSGLRGDAMTVTVAHVKPLKAIVAKVGEAMAKVTHDLAEVHAPTLLAQGQMLGTDESQIRSEAYVDLGLACGCDPHALPQILQDYFDGGVAYELARIERYIALADLQRQRDMTALELRSIMEESVRSDAQARFAQLLPTWTLRQLDAAKMQGPVDAVIDMADGYLYPILSLRYPAVLQAVRNDDTVKTALNALRSLPFDMPLDEAARRASVGIDQIALLLRTSRTAAPSLEPTVVVLGFPRPGVGPDNNDVGHRHVDAARAAKVWDELRTNGKATFTILPEDLYSATGGNAVLGCNEAFPIIRAMAVHIATKFPSGADGWNGNNNRAPLVAAADATFVTALGTEQYRFGNPAWLGDMLSVLLGKSSNVVSTFTDQRWSALSNQGANGLSPFTSFTVDLSAPGFLDQIKPDNAATGARELFLVMQVERQRAGNLDWVSTCHP